jgi:hypothetical protein
LLQQTGFLGMYGVVGSLALLLSFYARSHEVQALSALLSRALSLTLGWLVLRYLLLQLGNWLFFGRQTAQQAHIILWQETERPWLILLFILSLFGAGATGQSQDVALNALEVLLPAGLIFGTAFRSFLLVRSFEFRNLLVIAYLCATEILPLLLAFSFWGE